jgi:hypothetical protein
MKKWLSLLMIFPILLLSACAVAQVSYRLADDYTVNIDYMIELDPGNTGAGQYTGAIMQYWTEMGFTPKLDQQSDMLTLTGTKQDKYDSAAAAADAFSALLMDDNSLFQDAKFTYTPSYEYDHYSLTATVSLQDIIRQNGVQSIPEGEIEELEGEAADGTYTLSIALPGEMVSTNAQNTQDGVYTWTLAYDEVTQISLETSRLNRENMDQYADLQAQQQRDKGLLWICAGAGVVLIAALVIATILRNRKAVH